MTTYGGKKKGTTRMKNSYSKIRLSTVLLGGMLAVGVLATNVAAETPAEDGVDFGSMLSVPTMLTSYGAIEQLDFDVSERCL